MNNPRIKRRKRASVDQVEEGKESDDTNPPPPPTTTQSPKKKNLKEILSSLMLLEEQEKFHEEASKKSAEEENMLFEDAHKKKTQALLDYYHVDIEDRYKEADEAALKRRKSSLAAATAAASLAVAAADNENQNENENESSKPKDGKSGTHHRRLWVKDRSKAWWDECSKPEYPEEEFKKAFRMGKETFDLICEELNSHVAKEDTTLRNAIPVRQRVAVCIWRLATGEPLRLVSKKFGLGISTCHKLILEVCSAIRAVLMPKYLQWPNEEALKQMKQEFESISGIPNVVGSMYTTHVPIIAPKVSVDAYLNKRHTERNHKTSYSITVQGVVDPRGIFTDVCIGWPGSMPDDQVLEKSALYQRANGGLLNGVWVVGGSGYPLMDWVLVPYTQQNRTWTQYAFNEKIAEIKAVAKGAFVRLKGRWGCLQKRTEVKLQDLPVVLGACCVLHNICEMRGEDLNPELRIELVDDEMVPENPMRSVTSMKARETIAHNLLHHGLAGTSFL